MTKQKPPRSPRLTVKITDEIRQHAIRSNSGSCLISDAIKDQYPHLTNITTDMATIRVTDGAAGYRYTYLTPQSAQQALLWFDQGWNSTIDTVNLRQAVKIDMVRSTSKPEQQRRTEKRAARLAELREKVAAGDELTTPEKRSLSTMERNDQRPPRPPRPANPGPVTDVILPKGDGPGTVVGGRPIAQGKAHPNLLRGRNRHFGAKLADPGVAFTEAVEEAVKAKLAESGT